MDPRDDHEIHDAPVMDLKGGPDALRPYAGKVVAIVDGEVRASAETWKDAMRAADEAGLVDPLFQFVPGPGHLRPRVKPSKT